MVPIHDLERAADATKRGVIDLKIGIDPAKGMLTITYKGNPSTYAKEVQTTRAEGDAVE